MSRFSRPTRRSVSSPVVAQFGDTRIPLAPPLPVRGAALGTLGAASSCTCNAAAGPPAWRHVHDLGCPLCPRSDPAPKAAHVRSFTGTVTMPTEPKTQKPRDFLRSEARRADREADTRESAWKGGKVNMYPSTEPNYAWNRGYAAGIRVALCILAEKSEDSAIDRVRCPKCDDTGRTCPGCGAA